MEGFGEEVIFFGLGTIVSGCLLLRVLLWGGRETENSRASGLASEAGEMSGRTRTGEVDCCICLGETQMAVETNCGHIYCGQCILEVWRRSASFSPTPCPYCRTVGQLTYLLRIAKIINATIRSSLKII